MYIQRHIQTILKQLMEQFPAVLVTGPRQVGKSTLLQYSAPEYGVRLENGNYPTLRLFFVQSGIDCT